MVRQLNFIIRFTVFSGCNGSVLLPSNLRDFESRKGRNIVVFRKRANFVCTFVKYAGSSTVGASRLIEFQRKLRS